MNRTVPFERRRGRDTAPYHTTAISVRGEVGARLQHWFTSPVSLAIAILFFACSGSATTYSVGPNRHLRSPSEVPWESLQPGDEVVIDWQVAPYKDKWVICRQGTERAPITVRGVPGPNGQLPIIDGNGAKTRQQLQYWGDTRGVVKIGGAKVPQGVGSHWIVIENLEIRSGRPPYTFTANDGKVKPYGPHGASLYVEKVEHLLVRNCILHDSAEGLFISSNDISASRDITVEGCHIYDNGLEKSGYQHNVYAESIGITFQFNQFGPLRTNCLGNNIKDRSAGTVIRYNWIEGGDKELDLVDGEDSLLIRNDPLYRKTFVYGNVLIKPATRGHPPIVHFGGDGAKGSCYRHGTLYFYNNTVISYRKDPVSVFWLSDEAEMCDCRNNIFYTATNGKLALLADKGTIHSSHNWLKRNWKQEIGKPRGILQDDGTSIMSESPGFVNAGAQDFRLTTGSACRDAGTALGKEALPKNDVLFEYLKPEGGIKRAKDQKIDLGAFEFGSR